MAVSARELLLIVRAQNQASGALRRVGADMQALGRSNGLRRAQQQLSVNEQNLMRQRMRAERELRSIQDMGGRRNLALQARQAQIQKDAIGHANRLSRLERDRTRLIDTAAAAQARLRRVGDQLFARETQRLALQKRLEAVTKSRTVLEERARKLSAGPINGPNGRFISTVEQKALTKAQLAEAVFAQNQLQRQLTSNASAQARNIERGSLAARSVTANAVATKELDGRTRLLTANQEKLAIASKQVGAAQAAEAARAAELRAELATVSQRLRIVRSDQAALNKEIRAARWDQIARGGSIFTHLGRVATYAGLAVGGAFAYMADKAAKFQTEASLAATQVANKFGKGANTVLAAQKQIGDGILKIMQSRKATATSGEQNAAAYDIFSSMTLKGTQEQQVKKGLALLQVFNKAAIAGQVGLKEVTHAGITILNDFGKQGKQTQELPKFLNRMFASVRFGRTTVAEFVSSLNQVAPAFSAAFGNKQASFDSLSQMMAVLTRFMPSTRMAATALARLAQQFNNPDFVAGMKKSKAPITDATGHLLQMDKILEIIVKRFPELTKGGPALGNFFKTMTALGSGKAGNKGTIQAARAFSELVQHMGAMHTVSKQVLFDNNEFTKSFKALQSTPGVQWKEFVSIIHALAIQLGEQAIPAFFKLGKLIGPAIRWFQGLSKETKSQIGTWAVYGAAIALVVGTLSSMLGFVIRIVAVFGRLGMIGPVAVAIFVGIQVAVAALRGDIHSLSDAVTIMLNSLTPHSAWGWVAYLTIASLGALKLAKALVAVRNAYIGMAIAQGASGAGGVLGAVGGIGAMARTGSAARNIALAAGATRMSAAMTGVGAAAAGIGMALPIIGVGIAAAAGAALLWESHMKGVRAHTAEVAKEMKYIDSLGKAGAAGANKTSGLGGAVENALRAKIEVANALKTLRTDKKNGVKGFALLSDQLNYTDALGVQARTNSALQQSYNGLNSQLSTHAKILGEVGRQQKFINSASRDSIKWYRDMGMSVKDAKQSMLDDKATGQGFFKGVKDARNYIKELEHQANVSARRIKISFGAALTGLQRLGPAIGLPRKISAPARQDLMASALSVGRMLTLKEIKAVIKAQVDPASLRTVSAQIRNAVLKAQSAREAAKMVAAGKDSIFAIKPKVDKKAVKGLFTGIPVTISTTLKAPNKAASNVKRRLSTFFSKAINQPIHLGPVNPNMVAIGTQIANGIANGISTNAVVVNNAVDALIAGAYAAAQKKAIIKSPSQLFAKGIGNPIAEGVSVGILEKEGLLQKSGRAAVDLIFAGMDKQAAIQFDLFSGTWLSSQTFKAAEKGKKGRGKDHKGAVPGHIENFGDVMKDLNSQLSAFRAYDSALAALANRGAPKQMIEQLRMMGASNSKELTLIANATDAQLKRYVAAWRKARAEQDRSAKIMPKELIDGLKAQVAGVRQFNRDIAFLIAKKVPRGLVDQLRELGPAAAKQLNIMRHMSAKELKAYVATWKTLMKQVAIANKAQAAADIKQANIDRAKTIQDYLVSMFGNMKSNLTSAFGSILGGPKGIMDMISRNANMKSTLQGQFGALFDGLPQVVDQTMSNINEKVNWGVALNIGDLQIALQTQVDDFKGWAADIQTLASKGTPAALLAQLQDLGPGSKGFLDQLAGASSEQLAAYIKTWQEGQDAITSTAERFKLAIDPQAIIADLAAQRKAFDDWATDLQALRDRGLPEQLIQQLEALGPDADAALKSLLNTTQYNLNVYGQLWKASQNDIMVAAQNDFNAQLDAWRTAGINIGNAIVEGTIDSEPTIMAYFVDLARRISANLNGQLNLNLPPLGSGGGGGTPGVAPAWWTALDPAIQAAMRRAGTSPPGFALGGVTPTSGIIPGNYGGRDTVPIMAQPGEAILTRRELRAFRKELSNKDGGGMHFHEGAIQVTANKDESLETTLMRTMFRIRNRPTP